jgi:hypothetical protein
MPSEALANTAAASNQWISVTPLGGVADWYFDSLDTVRRLGNMGEGWDGYGSPSVPVKTTIETSYILSLISEYKVNSPHIAPVPGGGLQLEWDYENRALEIEIHPSGEINFLIANGEEVIVRPLHEKLLFPLLTWVRTGSFA